MNCFFGTAADVQAECGFAITDEVVKPFYAVEVSIEGEVLAYDGFGEKIEICTEAYDEVFYI